MSASVAAPASAHPHRTTFDPSCRLEDQAAAAALYSHRGSPTTTRSSVLDESGRLSSASAALSLRYARAQDLPSFPSTGGVKLASAGAAASLAEANKKPVELWTPGEIPAANTAAGLAKDYKMEPLWKPELSRAGSQAALIAHRDATPVDVWMAPETEHGHTAATSAAQNPKSPPPITERNLSGDGRQKALLAATASLRGGRRRADSAPQKPAPSSSHSAWALKAATSSHNGQSATSPTSPSSKNNVSGDPARIQNAKNNISRQMYTSNPPVSIEVEERRRQEVLKASAIAMAKKMFAIQQVQIDEARGIHRSQSHYAAHTRRRAQSDAANPAATPEPHRYENLEDAARKLAHERLSKLHDEHAEYRQYYGANTSPQQSRTFLRRGRRRVQDNIPEDDDDSDVEESRKIRQQMSLFQGKLAEIDNKKRQADRDALLAVAHKNVTARMNAMDEKVFSETGKTSPQQRELWERQARERAQRESDTRLINVGKVHIGGGKYLEQEEIDAIARARLQPTLDEITQKAEEQRAKDEENRLEQERVKAEQEAEKKRQAEIKADQKAMADKAIADQKAVKTEERRVQQEQRHEERRVKREQQRADNQVKDDARAAEKERRQSEAVATGKSRFFPSFLGRGSVAAGAAVGTAGAAVATETAEAVEGGAQTVTGGAPEADTAAAAEEGIEGRELEDKDEPELVGETVHDQVTVDPASAPVHDEVTIDPAEAAHAVAAGHEDEAGKPAEAALAAEVPLPADEEIGPMDDAGVAPDSSAVPAEETTAAAAPLSSSTPASPSKRNSRVKSFFKKLRTGSKSDINEFTLGRPAAAEAEPKETEESRTADPIKEEDLTATDSMRDVALAGRSDKETEDMYGGSAKPRGRVSPLNDETAAEGVTGGHGPAAGAGGTGERDVSPPSDTSSLSEEPYVIAADVASSRYSTEQGAGSKRNSGHDQLAGANLTDEEEEPRGRKGFRERFFRKVSGKDKNKGQAGTVATSAVGASAAAQTSAAAAASAKPTTTEAAPATVSAPADKEDPVDATTGPEETEANLDEGIDLRREKVQEPSTTSTEATANTTITGTTTPALTHAQTNGDDDEDFEEARDTFDEGRLVSASKVDSGAAKIVDVTSPMTPTTSKGRVSGEGSRFTEEL